MAKKQVSIILEEGDVDTLKAFSRAKKRSLSATCGDIIRKKILNEKILSGAVDMFSKTSMIEKRIDTYLKNFDRFEKRIDTYLKDFERRLKEMARNYKK